MARNAETCLGFWADYGTDCSNYQKRYLIENNQRKGRSMSRELIDAIVGMKEKESLEIAKGLLESGEEPLKILNACKEAMTAVGKRFEAGEFFLPELILAGEILRQVSEMVKPELEGQVEVERSGKVIIGTVEGDIHDIGKDIVAFMLDVNGFEVIDLGVDVPVRNFVEAIKESEAPVVGLSGFLTLAFDSMKKTIDAIKDAGLRDQVKIMIGGGQVDEEVRKYIGADALGLDAMEAVNLTKQWMKGGQS
jgi:5-methyltetrahydrofolate--homocysteine methyltransferase